MLSSLLLASYEGKLKKNMCVIASSRKNYTRPEWPPISFNIKNFVRKSHTQAMHISIKV